MYEITDEMPIEIWKEIAYKVQRLKISDCSDQEFRKNLESLRKLLLDLGIDSYDLSRKPEKEEEVGLAAFLQSIYDNANVGPHYIKAGFYEQIWQLYDLGIETIEFCPVDFYDSIEDLKLIKYSNSRERLDKAFTDGSFSISSSDSIITRTRTEDIYNIYDLEEANYILNVVLDKKYLDKKHLTDEVIKIKEANASLRNFNGIYPSKKEVMKFSFPEMKVPDQFISFGEQLVDLKQTFNTFDRSELSCIKRLTRTKDGQRYYKRENQSKNK